MLALATVHVGFVPTLVRFQGRHMFILSIFCYAFTNCALPHCQPDLQISGFADGQPARGRSWESCAKQSPACSGSNENLAHIGGASTFHFGMCAPRLYSITRFADCRTALPHKLSNHYLTPLPNTPGAKYVARNLCSAPLQ